MNKLVAAIHGIMTGQTEPSWPDRFDTWMFQRDRQVKVVKKEYSAGPFPRWNCWVKDPFLARSLANELELFLETSSANTSPLERSDVPRAIWMLAHSNGAVIALLAAGMLIERGYKVEGLILTGAACQSDIECNGILEWQGRGMLDVALAYCSPDDEVLPDLATAAPSIGNAGLISKLKRWFWGKLIWPYGSLGRTGWMLRGRSLCDTNEPLSTIQTRWYRGGHATYFTPENRAETFEQIYKDIRDAKEEVVL